MKSKQKALKFRCPFCGHEGPPMMEIESALVSGEVSLPDSCSAFHAWRKHRVAPINVDTVDGVWNGVTTEYYCRECDESMPLQCHTPEALWDYLASQEYNKEFFDDEESSSIL